MNLDEMNNEQAQLVLKKLVEEQPSLLDSIQRIKNALNNPLSISDISHEIFNALDLINVEDLWHNSGPTSYGYVDPGELAFDMTEDAISYYLEKFRNYLSCSQWEEAKVLGMGILQGLSDFETQSTSQFKDWAPDVADTLQSNPLYEWKNGCKDQSRIDELDNFFDTLA